MCYIFRQNLVVVSYFPNLNELFFIYLDLTKFFLQNTKPPSKSLLGPNLPSFDDWMAFVILFYS